MTAGSERPWASRTVLVTGGAGFHRLPPGRRSPGRRSCRPGARRFSNGRRENLPASLDIQAASLLDREAVTELVDGVDVVFHLAALGSVPRSMNDPSRSIEVNVTGTANVLAAARDSGVRRVVYASSSSVYGDSTVLPRRGGGGRASGVALRALEADDGAARSSFPPRLRPRDGRTSLLQRLWSAPAPGGAVRGGDPALFRCRAPRRPGSDSRRWWTEPRLHRRLGRCRRQSPGGRGRARGRRQSLECGHWSTDDGARAIPAGARSRGRRPAARPWPRARRRRPACDGLSRGGGRKSRIPTTGPS